LGAATSASREGKERFHFAGLFVAAKRAEFMRVSLGAKVVQGDYAGDDRR
jgi:hypothetical protein